MEAAKLAGIDRSHVYTMAQAPDVSVDLGSIEYVKRTCTPRIEMSSCLTYLWLAIVTITER